MPRTAFLRQTPRELIYESLAKSLRIADGKPVCPSCGARGSAGVTALDDPLYTRSWFFCRTCGAAGDEVRLASACWGVPLMAAAARLHHCINGDYPRKEQLDGYLAESTARDRIAKFWSDAVATRTVLDDEVFSLIERAGLQARLPDEKAAKRYHRLFGVCDKQDLVELYTGSRRPLPGRGWRKLLVFPFWDLPGRIAGFEIRGRELREQDRVTLAAPLPRRARASAAGRDLGVYLPGSLLRALTPKTPLLLLPDVMAAARQHAVAISAGLDAAPVGAFLVDNPDGTHGDGSVTRTLSSLVEHQPVLWQPSLSAAAVALAKRASCLLSETPLPISRPDPEHPRKECWRAWQNATTWEQALERFVAKNPTPVVAATFAQLPAYGLCVEEAASRLAEPDKVYAAIAARPVSDTVQVTYRDGPRRVRRVDESHYSLIERDDQTRLLADFVVDLSEVYLDDQGATRVVRGTLHTKGLRIPFTEKIRGGRSESLFAALQRRAKSEGQKLYCTRAGRPALLQIAAATSSPRYTRARNRVGWDGGRTSFFAPHATLTPWGVTHPTLFAATRTPLPAAVLSHNRRPVGRRGVELLIADAREGGVLIPVLFAAVAGVCAEMVGEDSAPLFVGGRLAREALDCCGVTTIRPLSRRDTPIPGNPHMWPAAYPVPATRVRPLAVYRDQTRFQRGMLGELHGPAIAAAAMLEEQPLMTSPIAGLGGDTPDPRRQEAAGAFLNSLLAHLVSRRGRINRRDSESYFRGVWRALLTFAERIVSGAARTLRWRCPVWTPDAACVFDAVVVAVNHDLLAASSGPLPSVARAARHCVVVSRERLDEVAAAVGGRPDFAKIARSLKQCGVLHDNGNAGLLVDRSAWERRTKILSHMFQSAGVYRCSPRLP